MEGGEHDIVSSLIDKLVELRNASLFTFLVVKVITCREEQKSALILLKEVFPQSITHTGWIVITVWFTDYGITRLFKSCHILGQQFVQKCGNRYKKRF